MPESCHLRILIPEAIIHRAFGASGCLRVGLRVSTRKRLPVLQVSVRRIQHLGHWKSAKRSPFVEKGTDWGGAARNQKLWGLVRSLGWVDVS